jgi:DNA invertase Pin-like site-specific DNA recombinase
MDEKDKAMWVHTLWDPLEKIDQSPLHSKKDGIKVAAYCRVSPNFRGVPESLMNQISQYTHMISSKPNWKFIGVYFDNQVTGRKASLRRGFSRMLRHCEEGKIDLILVKSVSRFSRNAKELVEIINRLNELNVTVYFEVENVESTRADSNYLLKTYAAIAQCEVEELSSIIEWGHEKQFIKGVPLLGNLYGYKRMKKDGDKIIQIIEKEATIIREIFQMYLEGKSYTEISNILEAFFQGRHQLCRGERNSIPPTPFVTRMRQHTGDTVKFPVAKSAGIPDINRSDVYLHLASHRRVFHRYKLADFCSAFG